MGRFGLLGWSFRHSCSLRSATGWKVIDDFPLDVFHRYCAWARFLSQCLSRWFCLVAYHPKMPALKMRCWTSKSVGKKSWFSWRWPFPGWHSDPAPLKQKNAICYWTKSHQQYNEQYSLVNISLSRWFFGKIIFSPTDSRLNLLRVEPWNPTSRVTTRLSASCRFSTYFWWHRAIGCFTNPSWKLLSWG